MAAAFADVPEAMATRVDIARRCDFEFKQRWRFPVYQVPPGTTPSRQTLRAGRTRRPRRAAERAPHARLRRPSEERAYEERLAYELGVITQMGFAGYFLIVADFINWAKEQGIPVGPGRGSAAGSVVAWALRITDLDPIEHGLLFERFLNPERRSMPDIDVDFCFVRRDEVIRYVREKYGADRVAQIVTFGTLKGKAAIKDVGRVLDFTFAETDRIAKLYPEPKQGKDFPLAQALEMEPRLRELRDSGRAREAALRPGAPPRGPAAAHASKHAAGVVIAPQPLTDDVPLWVDKDGAVVTQYTLQRRRGDRPDQVRLPRPEDPHADRGHRAPHPRGARRRPSQLEPAPARRRGRPTSSSQRADTVGVFQLESGGIRRMLTQLKPSCFADVVAVLALYRPGPLDAKLDDGRTMVDVFIRRKHGRRRSATRIRRSSRSCGRPTASSSTRSR